MSLFRRFLAITLGVILGFIAATSYNGVWSQPQVVPARSGFWAISCSEPGSCVATTGGKGDEVLAYSEGRWKALPAGPVQDLNWDVTCPSNNFCFFSSHNGQVVALSHGRWVDYQKLFVTSGSPLISCPTRNYCLSIDRQPGSRLSCLLYTSRCV